MQLFLTILLVFKVQSPWDSMSHKNVYEIVDDWYYILGSSYFSKRQCSIGRWFWFRFIFQMANRICAKLDQYQKDNCEGIGTIEDQNQKSATNGDYLGSGGVPVLQKTDTQKEPETETKADPGSASHYLHQVEGVYEFGKHGNICMTKSKNILPNKNWRKGCMLCMEGPG